MVPVEVQQLPRAREFACALDGVPSRRSARIARAPNSVVNAPGGTRSQEALGQPRGPFTKVDPPRERRPGPYALDACGAVRDPRRKAVDAGRGGGCIACPTRP